MDKRRHGIAAAVNSLIFILSANSAQAGQLDLSLQMTATPSSAYAGQALTYSLCASNPGSTTAKNVVITNPLPANAQLLAAPSDCLLKTEAKGQNRVLTCKAKRLPAKSSLGWSYVIVPETANELLNTASVKFNGTDINPSDNDASLVTPILAGDGNQASPISYKLSDRPKNAPLDVNRPIAAQHKTRIYPIAADAARDCAPISTAGEQQTIANAHSQLAFAVLDSLKQDSTLADANNVFSTTDTLQNLAVLAEGANGKTLQAILTDTRTELDQLRLAPAMNAFAMDMAKRNRSAQLNQPFALWGQGRSAARGASYRFASRFLNSLSRNYGAAINQADFTDVDARYQSIDSMSQWLMDSSQATIAGVSVSLSKQTRLTSISTTSLDSTWQFSPAGDVTEERFLNLDDSQVLTPMLSFSGEIPYAAGDGYQAFDLPLADSSLALTVLMPDYGRFSEFQTAFSREKLEGVLAAMQPKTLTLHLPKTQIWSHFASEDEVEQTLFQNTRQVEQRPNFSRVNGKGFLLLNGFSSRSVVSLTETGIQAHSATQSAIDATQDEPRSVWDGGSYGFYGSVSQFNLCNAIPHWDPDLALSRSFLFALRDRDSGAVLFIGQLTKITGTAAPADWTSSSCPIAFATP